MLTLNDLTLTNLNNQSTYEAAMEMTARINRVMVLRIDIEMKEDTDFNLKSF